MPPTNMCQKSDPKSRNFLSLFRSRNFLQKAFPALHQPPESSQKHFKDFFDVLLDENSGNILYHCTGGKDRTGLATLFILTLLGVDEKVIIKDFAQSNISNRRHNLILITVMHLFLYAFRFKRMLIAMLYAKVEYLKKTILFINEKYGSVREYLRNQIGIDDIKQQKLKDKYLI